jgi:hypothetical protein
MNAAKELEKLMASLTMYKVRKYIKIMKKKKFENFQIILKESK